VPHHTPPPAKDGTELLLLESSPRRVPRVSRGSRPGTSPRSTIPLCPSSQHEPISCIYSGAMPWGLERWHGGHDLHFITFSCYRRQALLSNAHRCELFLKVLEDVRRRYQWVVIGYVVMPEQPPQQAQRRRLLVKRSPPGQRAPAASVGYRNPSSEAGTLAAFAG